VILYLDTSALVKLVVEEPGSDLAARVWDAADVRVTSLLTFAETRAAIAAARRDGRLTARGRQIATSTFEARWAECVRIGISERLVREVGDLADAQRLRAYDAVHLASALRASSGDAILATWDRPLAVAARRAGLSVVPS
jgi:predicted nucleic acid-binding protein